MSTTQEQEFDYRDKVWDYLPDFVMGLKKQLEADDRRWGDTWKKRPKEGQEDRIRQTFDTYFDQYENAGVPINWEKVVGNALICWIRDYKKNRPVNLLEEQLSVQDKNEDVMWEMINEIGWGTKSIDYKKMGGQLNSKYSLIMISKLNTFIINKSKLLEDRFYEYLKSEGKNTRTFWSLGDDGYWDLRAHIVGLGKDEYKKAFANPEIAKKRADDGEFKENFCYIFHHLDNKK